MFSHVFGLNTTIQRLLSQTCLSFFLSHDWLNTWPQLLLSSIISKKMKVCWRRLHKLTHKHVGSLIHSECSCKAEWQYRYLLLRLCLFWNQCYSFVLLSKWLWGWVKIETESCITLGWFVSGSLSKYHENEWWTIKNKGTFFSFSVPSLLFYDSLNGYTLLITREIQILIRLWSSWRVQSNIKVCVSTHAEIKVRRCRYSHQKRYYTSSWV